MTRARRDGHSKDPSTTGATYTALASHWDGGWDVFVLHHRHGLIGETRSETPQGIEAAARACLSEANVAPGVKIDVVQG